MSILQSIVICAAIIAGGLDEPTLSPATWDDATRERLFRLNAEFQLDKPMATGAHGAIAGTTGAPAIYAGLRALETGGSAADAVVTTALTQVALSKGSWVSYAGIWTMVYYDAASDTVHNLNAGYNTVLGEDDPMSIPRTNSGRTALVPGFMAGAEATHERFGRLPWADLFAPAIHLAESGFELTALNHAMIESRRDVLSRRPDTKSIFTRDDGSFYAEGDLFTQPELARTLANVASHGADYMYTGAWAERLVEAVQADGGRLSMDDMRAYKPMWTEPLVIDYRDYEIHTHGLPAQGGMHLAETLHLADLAGLAERGRYTESAETLFWLCQFTDQFFLSFLPPTTLAALYPDLDLSYEARTTRAHAEIVWSKMEAGTMPMFVAPNTQDPRHSDAIVAIDQWGNVAAVVHTINTASWGATGIFVDGVSIPDSASFQQQLIATTGPGQRLPDPTEPLIIFKDGSVHAALSSIGSGLHQKTTTTLLNLLDDDMNIKAAIDAPSFHLPDFGMAGQRTQVVFDGGFDEALIDEARDLGLAITIKPDTIEARSARGYMVGVAIDPVTGERHAVVPRMFNAKAHAH